MRIAHIINPVKVSEDRDLHWQQPITFRTMLKSVSFIDTDEMVVRLYATFYPECEEIVPLWMGRTKPLEKSALDLQDFGIPRKLPLFREILDRLYESSDADYFIQTNADIGLMPYFYTFVKSLIDGGCDSFCINKRIIPEELKEEDLSVMWSTLGLPHAGCDCFVFRRELYPKFDLGDIVMGTPWSETTLITNLVRYAKNFNVFKNAHATFHLGDRRIWLGHEYNDYRIHNTNEFARVLKKLSKGNRKILEHDAIKNQLGKLHQEVTGYSQETYSKDCWYFVNKR